MSNVSVINVGNRHSDQVSPDGRGKLPTAILNFTAAGEIAPKRVVSFASNPGQVVQAASPADAHIGVYMGDVVARLNDEVPIALNDIVEVEAGAAIAQGDNLTADSLGRAVTSADGDLEWGVALEGALGAGSIIRAKMGAQASSGGIPESEKGQPGGVATLDGTGKISASELPPLEHDVGEAANQAGMLALAVTAPAMCLRTDFTPPHIFFLTADPASTLANWHDTGELGAGAANPTALVGPAAINGVANSYMRSDGAPGINLAAIYPWTGQHSFAANTGFGTTTPHAPIQTGNAIVNRKVVLFEAADNDHQYYGFGVNSNILRYQTSGTTAAHVFYAAASTTVSNELFRIYGTGGFLSPSPSYIVTGADGSKLWLAKFSSGTGHNNAPTTLGATSTYLYIGGREYGNNGFGGIGFGYISDTTNHPSVWVGYEEKNTAGNTNGDFIIATRPTTTNVAPTEAVRVTAAGATELAGVISKYNGINTAGVGMPAIYVKYDTASHVANIAPTTLYTVPANGAGMYRVFAYAVETTAATTSSTLPNVGIVWTDSDANVGLSSPIVTPSNAANTVGAFGNGAIVINARANTIIQFQTSNYASAGATGMQYAVHLRLEFLG